MPTERIIPPFNKTALDEKIALIKSIKEKYIAPSQQEIAALSSTPAEENTRLIEAEKNKIQLARILLELLETTETVFIPKMHFLHQVLSAIDLDSVEWLDDSEKRTLGSFNLLLQELIENTSNLLNLSAAISGDGDIFSLTYRVSEAINSNAFKQYFQAMSMLSVFLTDMQAMQQKHPNEFKELYTTEGTKLIKPPYNYKADEDSYLTMGYIVLPMQMTLKYSLFYNGIKKCTLAAIQDDPENTETQAAHTAAADADQFLRNKSIATNTKLNERMKPISTPVEKTQTKDNSAIIQSSAIGVAAGALFAFALLALGIVPPVGLGVIAFIAISAVCYGVIGGLSAVIFDSFTKQPEEPGVIQVCSKTPTKISTPHAKLPTIKSSVQQTEQAYFDKKKEKPVVSDPDIELSERVSPSDKK